MYSKQFLSDDEAITYMESKGTVKYYGREEDTYIYTLTIGSTIYQIMLRDGYLNVFHIRYE